MSDVVTKTIDAKDRALGRVASEVAVILLGKDDVSFAKHIAIPVKVEVNNVAKMKIGEKKLKQKKYLRYTEYPGGLREEKLFEVIEKKGHGEVLRRAVAGMLPKNKLHKPRMKNLIINE